MVYIKTVFPTGRFFGGITQKWPNKKKRAGQSCGRSFADFVQKGPNLIKTCFSLILSNSVQIKEILYFPRHVDTDNKIFISPKLPYKIYI
jgi:hypothetical protein